MTETLHTREGKRVPDVAFRIRRDGDWATITTDDIFARKNVVVFSLPGPPLIPANQLLTKPPLVVWLAVRTST